MAKVNQKSMKKSAILMMLNTSLSLVLPLITFPYIARVLQVGTIGKYQFSSSIVSYFVLIAGLGISTYAIREGAKVRDNREKMSAFVSEIYLLNMLSMIISYIGIIIAVVTVKKLHNYTLLILVLSVQIFFTTYGKSWIYNIYEEFEVITVVQFVVQLFSLVLLFVFVHSPGDVVIYAIINVVSSSGANLFYGIRAKKYVDFHLVDMSKLKKHIKPSLIIFTTSIATTIYVNSDMTILGWLVDDKCVGLYSSAVKIYNIIKQVMVAVITVTVPRLTLYANTDKFKPLFLKVFNTLLLIALPATTGLFMTSKNILLIIAGEEYVPATTSLQFLSVALVFALVACLFGTGVLLPYMKEKVFLWATVASAVINIVLNSILIPFFAQNAAAFTTVLSQAVAFLICYSNSKDHVDLKGSLRSALTVFVGCFGIVIVCMCVSSFNFSLYHETVLEIFASSVAYFVIQALLKNKYFVIIVTDIINNIKRKIVR